MNFGKLDRKIIIKQKVVSGSTALGGTTQTSELIGERFANITPLSQAQSERYGLEVGQRNYEIFIRKESQVISQDYFIEFTDYEGLHTLLITEVLNVKQNDKMLKIICHERRD